MAAPAAAPFLKSINAGDGGAALQGGGVKWFEIQENTFRRWVNDELKKRGMAVQSMKDDWKDGLMLVNLMEIISAKSLGRCVGFLAVLASRPVSLTRAQVQQAPQDHLAEDGEPHHCHQLHQERGHQAGERGGGGHQLWKVCDARPE
jgi:hypothetical protein